MEDFLLWVVSLVATTDAECEVAEAVVFGLLPLWIGLLGMFGYMVCEAIFKWE